MLSTERNEALTRVGRGTPAGELLRRYWYPVAAVADLDANPVVKVRLLGEDLALYRDGQGTLGLVAEACPHRRASMAYGIPEEVGLRCPYHGWLFNDRGACLEQPAEAPGSTFKDRITTTAYPVQELGGMIFAYLGPEPAPLLPRFDLYVWEGMLRSVGRTLVPCNWLQIMENSVDATHAEWLHGRYFNYVLGRQEPGSERANYLKGLSRHHIKIGFDRFEWGIIKRRVLEGNTEEHDDWAIGHPLVFPFMLRVGNSKIHTFQIRVPVDDTNTMHYWYTVEPPEDGVELPPQRSVPIYEVPWRQENGAFIVDYIDGQDVMCWVTQGDIAQRNLEHLGTSDKGIILLRGMLAEQIDLVKQGRDPMGVIRDPAQNEIIVLPEERNKTHTSVADRRTAPRLGHTRYNPYHEEFQRLLHGEPVQSSL
jgi:5,5'-dehydrodivanillate O-demethylase oxygenase subunit